MGENMNVSTFQTCYKLERINKTNKTKPLKGLKNIDVKGNL